jgi:hypothetical protein
MGGSNDPSNIIELTIEEHAEAHKSLYEQYGNVKDKVAWLALSKLITKKEVMRELHKLGRKKTDEFLLKEYGVVNPGQLEKNRVKSSERAKLMHKEGKLKQIDWTGRKHKPETIEKMKRSAKGKHTGNQNSQYGTCWITNGQENKKIKKEELDKFIQLGYYKGRIAGLV